MDVLGGFSACSLLASESAAGHGAIRADKMCLLQTFYLHPPCFRELLSHPSSSEDLTIITLNNAGGLYGFALDD